MFLLVKKHLGGNFYRDKGVGPRFIISSQESQLTRYLT